MHIPRASGGLPSASSGLGHCVGGARAVWQPRETDRPATLPGEARRAPGRPRPRPGAASRPCSGRRGSNGRSASPGPRHTPRASDEWSPPWSCFGGLGSEWGCTGGATLRENSDPKAVRPWPWARGAKVRGQQEEPGPGHAQIGSGHALVSAPTSVRPRPYLVWPRPTSPQPLSGHAHI